MNPSEPVVSVEFEVYGKVQGVFFTKYCKEMCESLGISGWVKNSKRGTIQGRIQGLRASVDHLVFWLSNSGSPGSKIERCELSNRQTLARPEYREFSIRF